MYLAFVAQLAARGSHNPKVAGSIPVESRDIPVSLGGQDTRLSPESPGFNSRTGNFFSVTICFIVQQILFTYYVFQKDKNVVQVGFEPTPPKRLELESSALDHSATEPVTSYKNLILTKHDTCRIRTCAGKAQQISNLPP